VFDPFKDFETSGYLRNKFAEKDPQIVQELESTGRNLQHYCRELSRYFRNLLVARITGETTRLISAAPPEQERMRETAAQFSEEDLTRWLQITIDLYSQMQYSLQPRLHLELGLLRLVHAGRLQPIEDVIRGLSVGASTLSPAAPATRPAATKPASAPPPRPAPAAAPRPAPTPAAPPKAAEAPSDTAPPAEGSLKQRLASMLHSQKKAFTADAVEHAEVIENGGTVEFLVPRQHMLSLRGPEVAQCLEALLGRPMKTKITISEGVTPAPEAAEARPQGSDEALKRALDHPEVQKAQELFPGSAVRSVRDLKE